MGLKNETIFDFRNTTLSDLTPIEGMYNSNTDSFILEVKICDFKSSSLINTWAEVVHLIDKSKIITNDLTNSCRRVLTDYFNRTTPNNVADVLHIDQRLKWHSKPPLYYVMPWDNRSPKEAYSHRVEMMEKECLEYGMPDYKPHDGWKGFGPVSDKLINIELQRLFRIYQSIKKHGYLEKYGYIGGQIFMNGKKQIIRPRGGWHRLSVLKALKYETIPVLFKKKDTIIHKADAPYWPGVKKSLFSITEAELIFENIYN